MIVNNPAIFKLTIERLTFLCYNQFVQSKRKQDAFFDWRPLVFPKEGGAMDTMEVLTLLLLIFTALSYIDSHKKK